MRRTAALAVVAALCLAACGEPATSVGVTTSPPSTEGSSSSSSTSSSSTITEARDAAPDFTLGLGDGGTFVLSEEARPVYLVFWAEW
ncbi:MAG TPA: hypothetical protein VM848_03160 [Acidimicrobiia bacterium]|nr:hypothetical protein [Acidimicrobiia bacterium]